MGRGVSKMFRGRYGVDKLGNVLIISACVISLVNMFIRQDVVTAVLSGVSLALIGIAAYRMFSRDIARRQSELYKYLNFENRVRAWFARLRGGARGKRSEFEERRRYKYLSCPQCMQRLRVPRGKGRIRVTCTKCGNRFETKS